MIERSSAKIGPSNERSGSAASVMDRDRSLEESIKSFEERNRARERGVTSIDSRDQAFVWSIKSFEKRDRALDWVITRLEGRDRACKCSITKRTDGDHPLVKATKGRDERDLFAGALAQSVRLERERRMRANPLEVDIGRQQPGSMPDDERGDK
jgi:hypothetical protein